MDEKTLLFTQGHIIKATFLAPLQRSQRNQGFFQPLLCRTEVFKNSFLPYTINEWNKLDPEIRRIDSYVGFRKKLLSFIIPMENKTFSIYDPLGNKLLNRLRVDFSHLNEHKFRHNFADTLNPLCSCSLETESTAHFFYVADTIAIFVQPSRMN